MNISFKKGFTLIELLVVIAIISVLTAIVMSNFTDSKKKARDSKRVSDVAQMQLSLEFFFDRCNQYPKYFSLEETCPSNTNIQLKNYLGVVPTDPSTLLPYEYTNIDNTDYVIRAKLETNSSVLVDDVDGTIAGLVDCGTAVNDTNFYYCVQPR